MLSAPVRGAAAQPACAREATPASQSWPAPLDRVVQLHARDVELRDALARLQAAARLRLSYSAEALPLDRRVCMWRDRVTVGDALAGLLAGTSVHPVVAGADVVVLAPGAAADGSGMARRTGTLERVVVTGSAAGASQRELPVALGVVDGRALEASGTGTLATALDQAVPGMWLWAQSPSSLAANYASIRGASSFGVSYPKVYIDGIEVANPLLFTRFTPEMIERVEVIRGPQGAALYGADAISGVVNVVTRHEGATAGAPRALLRTSAGLSSTDFAANGVLAQDHALVLRGGGAGRSGALAVSMRTLGPFVPRAASENLSIVGSVRAVGPRTILAGTARFAADRAGSPVSPVLADVAGAPSAPGPGGTMSTSAGARDDGPSISSHGPGGGTYPHRAPGLEASLALPDTGTTQSLRQYTVGGSATFTPDARWTHVLVAGIDGYRLNGAASNATIASAVDSALRAARGGADRASLRASSVAHFGQPESRALTLTLAAEHSLARDATALPVVTTLDGPSGVARMSAAAATSWWSTTGAVVQTNVALHDALFLTGGMRLERTAGAGTAQVATLPMLGASWVQSRGDVTLKLRTAYGKGMRPPQTVTRATTWTGRLSLAARADLAPEVQSGVEAGADLSFGRALSLHVTRFDQHATGLIQPVTVVYEAPSGATRLGYLLQNVGAIDNRGWEMQGIARKGPLSATGSLTLVDSRVARVANGYRGDLRAGDRMLEVPARTMSLALGWQGTRWNATWGVSRASDWVNYDGLALGTALASGTARPHDFAGSELRSFWREYPGVTRMRASLAYRLRPGASLVLNGDNLLDEQRGEPDNVTVLPGRTLVVGLRAEF